MKNKYKATGFTRFLIFLIFFTPIAYIGASYYNGEDGIANIKKILNLDQSKEDMIRSKQEQIKSYQLKINELESEIKVLQEN